MNSNVVFVPLAYVQICLSVYPTCVGIGAHGRCFRLLVIIHSEFSSFVSLNKILLFYKRRLIVLQFLCGRHSGET